ncbi:MAG: lipoyl(octanoyl) transferase LipB [Lentimicrobiaceae bacterium]|nr:lipoyl(octanoyl) transferase LipB [Lentimicrobiaceae bacterium]
MKKSVIYHDLGIMEYREAWDYQEKLLQEVIKRKTGKDIPEIEALNYLLFCEHPHVYTLGKSGSEDNLLISYIQMQAVNATFFRTNRGGDITYHGPGQLVGYPIFDLEQFSLGVKKYIFLIEEAIILTLEKLDVTAERFAGATGVWLDTAKPHLTRKICAIGVRVSRGVTMHGFALNVNTDLNYFNFINPCGFIDKKVTSIEKETGKKYDMSYVKDLLRKQILLTFETQ